MQLLGRPAHRADSGEAPARRRPRHLDPCDRTGLAMVNDPDAGLVKRGFVLLGVMVLLGATVLFIIYQGPRGGTPIEPTRVEDVPPSSPGWEIRVNAAAALARRGSDQVSWSVFREMVDLPRMTANCREQYHDAQETAEVSARDLVVYSLKA